MGVRVRVRVRVAPEDPVLRRRALRQVWPRAPPAVRVRVRVRVRYGHERHLRPRAEESDTRTIW